MFRFTSHFRTAKPPIAPRRLAFAPQNRNYSNLEKISRASKGIGRLCKDCFRPQFMAKLAGAEILVLSRTDPHLKGLLFRYSKPILKNIPFAYLLFSIMVQFQTLCTKNTQQLTSPLDCRNFAFYPAETAFCPDKRTRAAFLADEKSIFELRANSTQLNSTQLNSTQLNSTARTIFKI